MADQITRIAQTIASLDPKGYEEGVRKVEAAAGRAVAANTKLEQSNEKVSRSTVVGSGALDRLQAANDKAFAAEQRRERQLGTLNRAMEQGSVTQDRYGRILQGINATFDRTAGGVESGLTRMQVAVGAIGRAFQGFSGQTAALAASFGTGSGAGGALNGALQATVGILPRLLSGFGAMGTAAGVAVGGAAALATGYAALAAVTATAQDRQAQFQQRLRNSLGDYRAAQQASEAIFRGAQQTGTPLATSQDSFTRLARNADNLGASNLELLQLSETIQKLGVISGASGQESAAGMMQLSQALASGRLNGDELRSVMENMPALARAIADGLGVGVGQLRAMGTAGELTGQRVFRALLSQTDRVRREFETMPDTVERAMTRMENSVERFRAALGQRINASSFIRGLFNAGSSGIEAATDIVRQQTPEERMRSLQAQVNANANAPAYLRAGAANELRNLEEERRRATQAASAEYARIQNAPISAGIDAARDLDEFGKRQREVQTQTDTLNRAIERLNSGLHTLPADQAAQRMETLQRALRMAQQEAREAADALTKFRTATDDLVIAQNRGGGGGGTAIEQRIQELTNAQLRQKGEVDPQGIRDAVTRDAAVRTNDQVQAVQRQVEAQERLNAAFGRGNEAVRQAQIEIDVLNFRFKNFGAESTPAIEAQVQAFRNLTSQLSDANRRAQTQAAARGVREQIDSARDQADAVGQGPYAQRRAAAGVAARYDQNVGRMRLAEFLARENLQARQSVYQLGLDAQDANIRAANANDPRARIRAQEDEQIRRAQLNVPGGQQASVAMAMAAKFDAERRANLAEQTASLREQLQYSQQQVQLQGQSGEQLAVSTALLDRQRELRQAGVDLASEEARTQLGLTEQLARSNYELEQRRREAAEMQRIWTVAAEGIQQALSDAFQTAFEKGRITGTDVLNILSTLAQRVAAQILAASTMPLSNALQNWGSGLLSRLLGGGGSSIPGIPATPIGGGSGVSPIQPVQFHSGGIVGIDGVPRNVPLSVFAGAPRYHSGGLAGDEVPAILRRGERVLTQQQQAAGGVSVVVNDNRSNAGSAPVETSQRTGPDGRRMIELTIRDASRKQMSSGEMDTSLATNYGLRRQLTRR